VSVALSPSIGQINETFSYNVPSQGTRICHAYLDGTQDQKQFCDNYPTNYTDMTCIEVFRRQSVLDSSTKLVTECYGSGEVGQAPYDKGDGAYGVYFVNRDDPSVRRTSGVTITSDGFYVFIEGRDYPPYDKISFARVGRYAPPIGAVTPLTGTLHISFEIKPELAGSVLGCATGYSIAGLSPDEIAKQDAEQIALCAKPTAVLQGREGWSSNSVGANIDRVELRYDATPLLRPQLHVIFAFAINGRVQPYIFENP
jgi:hypothetical protein